MIIRIRNYQWPLGIKNEILQFIDKGKINLCYISTAIYDLQPTRSNVLTSMPQVVILAGGLGTRLGDIAREIPKSLVNVHGKPILTHILDWARNQGCGEALILTGHLSDKFRKYSHDNMNLTFHEETEPLGTGGALWNAVNHLEDEFILLWGDDFHPIDYMPLVKHHRMSRAPITMTVTESSHHFNLEHQDGKVVAYDKEIMRSNFNGYEAGTSMVDRSVVHNHGKDGKWSWEETVYPALSGKIHAHLDNTPFWDMGTPERLASLENFFKTR